MTTAAHTIETVPVTTLATGWKLGITVHRLTGGTPGPTLVIFGGIHGDEAMGVEAVRRIVTSVDVEQLRGTILAVPVANPLSYESMTRHTLQDGLNLNRIFPGDAGGSITEQLAATLLTIIDGADHFIDFHSSGLYSTVDYAYVHDNGREMSEAYGTPLLYHHGSYPGSATGWALEHGIGAMVSELGGGGQLDQSFLTRATEGAVNVLRRLEMLPGEVVTPPVQTVMKTLITLRPRFGGILLSEFEPERLGESIPGGTVLGRVVDAYTYETVEELVAPYEQTLLVLTRQAFTRVSPGDYGFMVGDATTATTLAAEFGA
ncbi:MAG TPA: M14 family metallopeptidase [Gryllotalpicola sp.]